MTTSKWIARMVDFCHDDFGKDHSLLTMWESSKLIFSMER